MSEILNINEILWFYFSSSSVDILQHFRNRQLSRDDGQTSFLSCSNDDLEEGDPGSDSDFEIDAKKEVSDTKLSSCCLTDSECEHVFVFN